MADPRDFWHILPNYVKRDVVHYLDLKTRFNLSYCSKSDLKLVKSTPIAFWNISWYPNFQQVRFICFRTLNCPKDRKVLVEFENTQQAVDRLCYMLRAPNTCDTFFCSGSPSSGPQKYEISEMIRELKKHNIRPKIKCMNWEETVDDVFYEFVTQTDANYLTGMVLCSKEETEEQVNRIVATDQWKNLKVVVIGDDLNPAWQLESILDKPMFSIKMNELTVETAHRIIKTFQGKNHPVGSCFSVSFRNMNVRDMYDDPGELIEEDESDSYYQKKFPLANDSLELRVQLVLGSSRDSGSSRQISGIVNRKDENFEYFNICHKILFMLHAA